MEVTARGGLVLRSLADRPALELTASAPRAGREYSDWYLDSSETRQSDPAKSAYESAVEILQKELTVDEYQAIWLRSQNSMQDVQKAVADALQEYQTKSRGTKVRTWLANCSSRVMYYGSIFDMFSSHHPEYVSLAWGAMKFLFIAVLNHEELLVEISKATTNIADVLPRTELHSILYPTPRMQDAVAAVYAKILEFVVIAIKWYKKGKLMHSLTAIVKPFKLSFKPIVDEIKERSRRVDELANAASKAEIRDLHLRIHGLNSNLVQLTEMVARQQQQQALHSQSLLALHDEYKQVFRKGRIEEIRNTVFIENTDAPDQSLEYCRSMRNRRRQRLPTQLPVLALSKLKSWISDPASSLLLAEGKGVRTSSLDFAADFLDAVLEHDYPVIWALPSMVEDGNVALSVEAILKSLVSQALALNPSAVSDGINPVTVKHFKAATNTKQWLGIFERCISNLPRLFLVIDISLFETATLEEEDGEVEIFRGSDFVEWISEVAERRGNKSLKALIVSWRFTTATGLDSDGLFEEMQIFTDMGRRMNKLMRQPKYRSAFRKRNQKFTDRIRSSVQIADRDPPGG
ncbi:hypothetical protein GQ53DRAFT_727849 [Thozetella sp. PMI_491]|nr:hypothetical protein GQ53DRAFT_727849 [Thozetella sp. PMI_491]